MVEPRRVVVHVEHGASSAGERDVVEIAAQLQDSTGGNVRLVLPVAGAARFHANARFPDVDNCEEDAGSVESGIAQRALQLRPVGVKVTALVGLDSLPAGRDALGLLPWYVTALLPVAAIGMSPALRAATVLLTLHVVATRVVPDVGATASR